MKRFFKTVVQVEVLSEDEPLMSANLEDIDYEITYGHCSGVVTIANQVEVTPQKMAELLIKQGSDPEFFLLDRQGNSIEE